MNTSPVRIAAPDSNDRSMLTWLAEAVSRDLQALRESDDRLFSWAATIFVTALGAITSFRGIVEDRSWGGGWRPLLTGSVLAIVVGVLIMAWQIHLGIIRKNAELNRIIDQLGSPANQLYGFNDLDSSLLFYMRWGIVALIGIIAAFLTWITIG